MIYAGSMKQLHHVALGAHDVERVAEFYRTAFDLLERARYHGDDGSVRSVWLSAGEVLLMIEHTETPRRAGQGVGAGPFLLAFQVSPEERSSLEARLLALGSGIESVTEFSSYARDPEGNRVAISHYPRPPTEVPDDSR